MSHALLEDLARATTKDDMVKALVRHSGTRGFAKIPVSERYNNVGPIELATGPYVALVEGMTNAFDAIIVDQRDHGGFAHPPTNPHDALRQIDTPRVQVHVQKNGSKKPIVTVLDQGTGMTEDGMRGGVLTFGSMYKPADPIQHGCFGMGGATLFGVCQASLIISRTRDSDHYVFTMVWKNFLDDGTSSYLYAAKPDKTLFTAAASKLAFFRLDSPNITAALNANSLVLPVHGTVRRQVGMEIEANKGVKSPLCRSLSTRLFGSQGQIVIATDTAPPMLVRGLRQHLNAATLNQPLHDDVEGAVLLAHIPPKTVLLPSGEDNPVVIGIETWVVSEVILPEDQRLPYARTRLEGRKGDASANIIISLNGQTHARMLSSKLLRDAGLPYLAEHVILQVTLDSVGLRERHLLMSSNRENLTDQGREWIKAEIDSYLRSHELLADLNTKMTPAMQAADLDDTRDIASEMNRMMRDPLLGGLLIAPGKSSRAPNGVEVGLVPGVAPPFAPVDPPTLLHVTTSTVSPGRTCWLKIRTNAPNHYGARLRIETPAFLARLNPTAALGLAEDIAIPTLLIDGRAVPSYRCDDVALGTCGRVTVMLDLDDGSVLTAACDVTVAEPKPRKPGKPRTPNPANDTVPKVEITYLRRSDAAFSSVFPGCDPEDAAWNYAYDETRNVMTLYMHPDFAPLLTNRNRVCAVSDSLGAGFDIGLQLLLFIDAMLMSRNMESFGPGGASDAVKLRILTDRAKAAIATQTLLSENPALRMQAEVNDSRAQAAAEATLDA